jgi:hypothetical protein
MSNWLGLCFLSRQVILLLLCFVSSNICWERFVIRVVCVCMPFPRIYDKLENGLSNLNYANCLGCLNMDILRKIFSCLQELFIDV